MISGYAIKDLEQIRALNSAVRSEIIDIVELSGVSTIKQISALIGRSPHSLYFHVKILVTVGLLIETGVIKNGKQKEIQYDVPDRPMNLTYDLTIPDMNSAVQGVVDGILSMISRDFKKALEAKAIQKFDMRHNVMHTRAISWLSAEQVQELQRTMYDTISSFKSEGENKNLQKKNLYALSVHLVPLSNQKKKYLL